MRTNLLKLNKGKTELIMLGTRQQLSKMGEVSITIGNDTISTVPSVQNLGIHFDKELKWIVYINPLTSNLYYILRKVAHVQHLLNEEATIQLYKLLCCQKSNTATASTRVPLHMLLKSFNNCKTWVAE